jgi:hypothetical protein
LGEKGLRVTFYVDGFNVYYAIRDRPHLKWLDLLALARRLRPHDTVRVRYFTAQVTPLPRDPSAPARQRQYLAALRSLAPDLTIHEGHFTTKATSMPVVSPPPRFINVFKTEEKGSDVNLATFLLLDGADGLYDEAVVVSDDSDLEEPVKQAAIRYGPIHILSPRGRNLRALTRHAASLSALDDADLVASQFASPLSLRTGRTVRRPREWA